MAKAAPKRSDYPKGLIGQAKYDAALKRYKADYGPPSPKPAKPEGKVNRRGRVVATKPKPETKPADKQAPKPAAKPANVADYKDTQGNVYNGNTGRLRTAANRSPASADAPPAPAPLRSPAFSAPVHSKPQDFGSAYAPQAGQAPRPNTPQPAANPFAGIGDVRGQQMNPEAANLRDAPVQAGNQEYQGQTFQGIDANGNDMERRRAFLDADNSLDGMKAVRELLNRRKLSISVEN